MKNEFVEAANGVRYAYRQFGESTATPLLFLSHFRANLDMWDPLLLSTIAADRQVILVDNAGIGLSGGSTPATVEQMAHDIQAFTDALGLTEVDVLGFSIGGYVAQELALIRPALVRRMILAGTAPRGAGGDQENSGTVRRSATKDVIGPKDILFLFFAQSPTSRAKGIDFIRRLGQHRPEPDRSVEQLAWQAQLDAATSWDKPDPGAFTRLVGIRQPTLVANGESDIMVGKEKSYLLAERIPNATLRIFPDAGHGFLFQEPEEFGTCVLDFLR
jgi:pimeloyl-ACP methyl ester carboxylesterase